MNFKGIISILKGSGIIVSSKVVNNVSFLVITLLITKINNTESLGQYTIIFSVLNTLAIFALAGLGRYVNLTIPNLDFSYHKSFLFRALKIIIIFVIATTVTLLLAKELNLISDKFVFFINSNVIYFIFPFTFISFISQTFLSYRNQTFFSFNNILINLSILIILLVQVYLLNIIKIVPLIYGGIIVSFILSCLLFFNFLKKRKIFSNSKSYSKPILKFSMPMLLSSTVIVLMNNIDNFQLFQIKGDYDVGIYSACLRLSFFITFVLSAVNSYLSPRFSKLFHNKNNIELKSLYKSSIMISVFFSSPVFLILLIFPSFFLGLYGPDFLDYKLTLFILNLAYFINVLFGPTGILLNMTNNQNINLYILLIAFTVKVMVNPFLIESYGTLGASISTLLALFIWNSLSFMFLKNKCII